MTSPSDNIDDKIHEIVTMVGKQRAKRQHQAIKQLLQDQRIVLPEKRKVPKYLYAQRAGNLSDYYENYGYNQAIDDIKKLNGKDY